MDFKKALEEVKSKSKKRKFVQSIELIMNFKGINFSKPDSRINLEVVLPKGRGKKIKIAVMAGDALITQAKEKADKVIKKDEILKLGKNKKELKKLASEYDYFLCQTDLMALVGKHLGQVLALRDRMPKPVPPTTKLEPLIRRLERTVRVKNKGKFMPTIQTPIGTEEMSDEDVIENAKYVFESVKDKLPNKEGNIRSIYLKMSMGPAIKVE